MNDENRPLYMPCGCLVSEKALDKIASPANPQYVKCPKHEKEYKREEIKKVFFIWLIT